MNRTQLTYEAVCAVVGRLFLESQHEIQLAAARESELRDKLASVEKQRDEALAAMLNTNTSK